MHRLTLVVGALFVVACTAKADEESIPIEKLPKAVVETVKKRFPKAELISACKDYEDKRLVYEVQIKDGETKIDVTVRPNGTLLYIEKEIEAKDLPKAAMETLDKKYPKATLKTVGEIIEVKNGKELPAYYQVLLVTAENKTFEIDLSADGKIIDIDEK